MSCLASCCAASTCGLCSSVASGISKRSARLAYCGLFGLSLIVSWILREVAAPILEKIPCEFNFSQPFAIFELIFSGVREIDEYRNWFGRFPTLSPSGTCMSQIGFVSWVGCRLVKMFLCGLFGLNGCSMFSASLLVILL